MIKTNVLSIFFPENQKAPSFEGAKSSENLQARVAEAVDKRINFLARRAKTEKLTREELDAALDAFRGDISQIPPMYSALKVNGKKLYGGFSAVKKITVK